MGVGGEEPTWKMLGPINKNQVNYKLRSSKKEMCVLYGEEKCKIGCLKISMLKASAAAAAYFISTIL